ncbi:uncharacterized protein N7500_010890 [Penicillium coprophilum]|uniref:uncharacterized protein n=1 Tax=Penicillium coprophilum TaxID=36646 RepID=UPI00239E8B1E|nr:uncharacterized protein N7500_010890 [Penicillium coprophilum]KAJ5150701.1 hypothetical protein N7500_010890 [Penicillium coprophilum]
MPPVSKTCQSCADSKVRCVRDTDMAACNRKIAALESKINELKAGRADLEENGYNTSTRSISVTDGDAAPEDIISRDLLDIETAKRYLSMFRTKLTPHFPFVVVPYDVSIEQLRLEKPFLCLAILASASYENMPLQRALGDEVKKVVASRMVIGGEISFELLQGLLVFLAWIAILVQKKSTVLRLPYQEECCKTLREANEYPHDKYISYVIQLQFIAEKVDQLSARHGVDLEKPGSGSELYITNLKSDLAAFYRHLPFDINENFLLAIQYHATGLCLYQLALNITNQEPQLPFESSSWREEMSFSALISASSILNLYIQLPPNEEVGFNNTQWVQIAFALLVAYRHTVAASKLDQTAALLDTLSKLKTRVGALSTSDVDMNGARDVFYNFRNRIVQIENWLGRHGRQGDNAHGEVSLEDFQPTAYLEPTHFDGLIGAAEAAANFDIPHGTSFSSSADDLQIPQDFLSTCSFEQIMRDWA